MSHRPLLARALAAATALATGALVTAGPLALSADAAPAAGGRVVATPTVTPGVGAAAGQAATEPGHGTDPANPAGCDALDAAYCLLPFPSDFQTRRDASSQTGRRVDFSVAAMPRNVAGKPIEPFEQNRNDGFSPGQPIVTRVPGLNTPADAAASGIVPVTDMARSFDPDQAVVLIDAATGQRQLIWAEVDSNGGAAPLLLIHPGVNLTEDTRYLVALRHLRTAAGTPIPAGPVFAGYRDGTRTDARTAHMTEVLDDLEAAGIARDDLFLAWDFTVTSPESIAGRLLSIRDRAFAELGDTDLADLTIQGRSPAFHVDQVENFTPAENSVTARRVTLHVQVPCFITPDCATPEQTEQTLPDGSPLDRVPPAGSGQFGYADPTDPDAVPVRSPQDFSAIVTCDIPRVAIDGVNPPQVRPSLYGHGLFGMGTEVNAGHSRDFGQRAGIMLCGPDWFGMATQDVPNALVALNDLSRFPLLIDRVQQGVLDFLVVGRAMAHPEGFASDPAFQVEGRSLIRTGRLYYDGNSQGGIYGGTVVAVSPDLDRGVLGVPGMNYAVLLERSSDYKARAGEVGYSTALEASYPDAAERALILSLTQMLWDRGDSNGYALHLTKDPLPNTPAHEVLLQVGYGDHQVANVTADVMARSGGMTVLRPALEPGRSVDVQPYYGIPSTPGFPYTGSAMTVFDIGPIRTEGTSTVGTGSPPTTNTPPRDGQDPHEAPRRSLCGNQQKAAFLDVAGVVTDPCPGPYFAFTYTGATPAPVVPEAPFALLLPGVAVAMILWLRRSSLRPGVS